MPTPTPTPTHTHTHTHTRARARTICGGLGKQHPPHRPRVSAELPKRRRTRQPPQHPQRPPLHQRRTGLGPLHKGPVQHARRERLGCYGGSRRADNAHAQAVDQQEVACQVGEAGQGSRQEGGGGVLGGQEEGLKGVDGQAKGEAEGPVWGEWEGLNSERG